jgi:heme/copper-type cytochrome/quinol oxidase subunit 2
MSGEDAIAAQYFLALPGTDLPAPPYAFKIKSMSNSAAAELYFIAAMMILILILSVASVFFFVRQYKRETGEREAQNVKKAVEPETVRAQQTDIGLSE